MRTTRIPLACLLLAALAAGAGCYESLTSVVTPDKLIFDEDLIGEYSVAEPAGRVAIEKGEGKAYTTSSTTRRRRWRTKGSRPNSLSDAPRPSGG